MKKRRIPPWAIPVPAVSITTIWKSVTFEGKELYLAKVSALDLGITQRARYRWICARAQAAGLALCPRAAYVELTKHYPEMPDGEVLHIAADPYEDSGQRGFIITLRRHGKFIAHGSHKCNGETFFKLNDLFAFKMP